MDGGLGGWRLEGGGSASSSTRCGPVLCARSKRPSRTGEGVKVPITGFLTRREILMRQLQNSIIL